VDARRLRLLRLQLDMNQTQLAKELGVSQALVSAMEAGTTPVTARTVKQLTAIRREVIRSSHYTRAARLTGVPLDELSGADPELEEL
jgi:transcriptional regulator with XRE-family HTH domain